MFRISSIAAVVAMLVVALAPTLVSAETSGIYLETRTCQVYTGPCFANAEVGLTGKDAIMAWKVEEGTHDGIDLSGLSVVVVINATDTLDFKGIDSPKEVRSVIYFDEKADSHQREALVSFARKHAGRAGDSVVRIEAAPISMSLDTIDLRGQLVAGKAVKVTTRKARSTDCICSNETAYYPPLAKVENFAPGVAEEGKFSGRGLGTQWSVPGSRSAYMATFVY